MRYLVALLALLLAACATPKAEPAALPMGGSGPVAREANGRVAVLMYHHLAPPSERPEEPGVITPERFEGHLRTLRSEGYRLITAAEFADYLDGRLVLPGHSVLLTFDDGYESNYTLAFPLMKKYQAPGIIFPVGRFFDTDGKGAWSPHLVRVQAQEMIASGIVAFGGHSYDGHGHIATGPGPDQKGPWLASRAWLTDKQRAETDEEYRSRIREDLRRNRATLRAVGVTEEALHFALPNGASSPQELEELRALGFRYVYSTDPSQVNAPGVLLIYRVDAGSPHASNDWLRDQLRSLFGR